MPLSPLRKKLNIAFGLLLLGGVVMVLWPLVGRPLALWEFCRGLQADTSVAALYSAALELGFKVSPASNGVAQVYDLASLGKFSCALSVRDGVVLEARFVVTD